jgi:hypothetical protein
MRCLNVIISPVKLISLFLVITAVEGEPPRFFKTEHDLHHARHRQTTQILFEKEIFSFSFNAAFLCWPVEIRM